MTNAVPTPAVAPQFPLWAREPARIVGWIVSAIVVASALLVELANDVVDLLPVSWRVPVRAAVATVVTVGVIAGRLQTLMTRSGIGPAGNGKDGVWSPASAQLAVAHAQSIALRKPEVPVAPQDPMPS